MNSVDVLPAVGRLRPTFHLQLPCYQVNFVPHILEHWLSLSIFALAKGNQALGAETAFIGAVPGGSHHAGNSFRHGSDSSAKVAELQ
jgi:hypothetical protein